MGAWSRVWMHVLLLVFILFFPPPGLAEYQAGLDAYQQGDYTTALAEWKTEVSRQPTDENLAIYREALYAIAMLYWQGEGVEQDYTVSAVWLKQAADINHPGAQTKLGYLYTTGQGVPQNHQEAVRWFQMAAAQGDPDAVHNLDLMFEQGIVPREVSRPESVETSQPRPVSTEAAANQDQGEGWILSQDPEHYAIQVIALRKPEKLHAFIADHPDWAPFAIYYQSRYEKPLWVMVQGVYRDVEAAREAVQRFPGGIQERKELWIRKFGMIQGLVE